MNTENINGSQPEKVPDTTSCARVTPEMIEAACEAFLKAHGDPFAEPKHYKREVTAALNAALSAAPAAMPVEPVVNKAEIFCEPGDMPSPAHGGLARFVYYRLKLAGVEIASRSARYRWEPSFDVDKHEWPSDLVAMRDAINRALAAPPAPAVADGWSELAQSASDLIGIVEGIQNVSHGRFRAERSGERLHDTQEWMRFYVAAGAILNNPWPASPAPATPAEVERLREEADRWRRFAGMQLQQIIAAEAALSEANKRLDKLVEALEDGEALLETLAENLPEDHVDAIMMRVMAERHRAALNTIKGGENNG